MDGSIILPHLLLWEHPYPQQHPRSTDTLQDMAEEEICPCWRDSGNSHGVLEEMAEQ